MVNCQSCGAVNNEESISCVACNRTLQVVCPQCTFRNSLNTKICEQCGRVFEKIESKSTRNKSGDPVADMYNKPASRNAFTTFYPKEAFMKVVLGGFIFALLYLSDVFSGHPFLLLASGLLSGIVALWGLIEITFWVIDDSEIEDIPLKTKTDDFPGAFSSSIPVADEPFEQIDNEIAESSALAEKRATGNADDLISDSAIPDETTDSAETAETASPASTPEKPDEPAKKHETLAEFLSDGIEQEIKSIQEKISRSPANYALLVRKAQLHEERGEISLAIDTLKSCLKFEPETAEVYLYNGILLRKNGLITAARDSFDKALQLNRFMSKAYYQLGILEKSANNLKEARELLQKCIQLSPDDAYAHYQLGIIYKELGETSLAIMEIRRATILHPADSYGHSKLGQLYQQAKQHDLAIASYSQALSLKPDDPFVLERLGEVLEAKEMYERAAEIYQEAMAGQFHPSPATMVSLGRVLRKLEAFADLEQLANEILRLDSENVDARMFQAIAQIKLNKITEAKSNLESLTLNPSVSYEAWLELGKIYQAEGQSEKAISAFIRASTNAPDQAGIWNTIGILLSNQKVYEEALKAFRKAASFDYSDAQIASNLKAVQTKLENSCNRIIESRQEQLERTPDDPDAYLEIGKAFEVMQRPDDALMAYQRLLSIDHEHIPGLMHYAELLRKKGKLKMAMRCYREILKLQPENADTHLFMVQANLNLGFLNEALRHAVIAQKVAPDDPRVHFLLGKIYFAKGLAPRALKEFTLVAASNAEPDMISWAELMRRRLSRTS